MRREWRALRAKPWELALMSWWPLLLLAILWWTLAAGLPRNLPLVWVDHDKSASSRQLLQLLESSPTLSLSLRMPDEMAAMHAVRSGHALGWLVVPHDFERDIKLGVAPTVHLQVNAQQSTGAGMVKSQVQTALALFSAGAELKIRTAQGEPAAAVMTADLFASNAMALPQASATPARSSSEGQAAPTKVIDRPLRSGQRVYARGGDLVVLGLVSHGAEVIADGNIHIYGPLRGRAIAGANGDADARIFAAAMEPELISIAGTYRTTDKPLADDVLGKPAQVRLDGDRMLIEPLKN